MQQLVEGMEIYQRVGKQDLTADVNFSDLQGWSQAWVGAGRLEELASFLSNRVVAGNDNDRRVMDPMGVGSAFWVLSQVKTGSGTPSISTP